MSCACESQDRDVRIIKTTINYIREKRERPRAQEREMERERERAIANSDDAAITL